MRPPPHVIAALLAVVVIAAGLVAGPVAGLAAAAFGRAAGLEPRATSAPGCPGSDRRPPDSTRTGAGSVLVPDGAESLLLCRYDGLGEPGARAGEYGLLASAAVTAAATVTQLAGELNAIPATPPATPIACPADFGQTVLAYFGYPSGPADPVTVDLGGCDPITNGPVSRLGLDAPVVGRLSALVPAPSIPLGPGPVVLHGTIAVTLELCGGAALPGHSPCRVGTDCEGATPARCRSEETVEVLSGSERVASRRVRDGRPHLRISEDPGRYSVELLVTGGVVEDTGDVTVRADRTADVVLRLPVK